MANGEFIDLLSPSAIANIRTYVDEILKGAEAVDKINASLKNVKMPSENKGVMQQVTNEIKRTDAQRERSIKIIERNRLSEIKLQQDREKAFAKFEANLAKENASLARNESLYNKVQQKVNSLSRTYNDIAIKKQLGINLSDREIAQLTSLESRLNKYQGALKQVDANIQKNQRNVGNYTSGWNGLSNSINQITRELPAFTFSAQTGFLALSNNIPILTDEISKLSRQNKELIAQGKPVTSMFSQILRSVLSLQTAMGIGILLFTLYGKEIGDWISQLLQGAKATDVLKESTKQLNDIRISSLKSITEERVQLANNLKTAKDTTLSYKEREIAAKKILDQYPYWFESLGKEAIMNKDVQLAIEGVNNALLARAKSNAAISKITENQSQIIDLEEELRVEQELLKAREKRLETVSRESIERLKLSAREESDLAITGRQEDAERNLASTRNSINKITKEKNRLEELNARLLGYSAEETAKAIGLDYRVEKIAKERVARKKEENILDGLQAKNTENIITTLEGLIKKYEDLRHTISRNGEEYRFFTQQIDGLKQRLNSIIDLEKELHEGAEVAINDLEEREKATERQKEAQRNLNFQTDLFIQSITGDFFSKAGLSSINFFTQMTSNGLTAYETLMAGAETWEEKFAITFKAITDVAKEGFAFIDQVAKMNFDRQVERLGKERDVALMFAGESATAREEIERQYDERRKQIERQRVKQQKESAIFSAIINTAQGVVAALANPGGPAGVALAVAVGAIGAAQIALIASQQVPEYAEGTENHAGGLAIVGDGGKREIVYQPSKGLSVTPKTDTLVDLEKGSKVFPDFNSFLRNSGSLLGGIPNIELESKGASASEIDGIMGKYFKNIQTNNVTFDKNGIAIYSVKQGQKTVNANNRASAKGYTV